jgi:hypothetical protein
VSQPFFLFKTLIPLSSNGIGSIAGGQSTTATLNTSALDTGRRIAVISSAGTDISGAYFFIAGTREGGGLMTEAIKGSTGTATVMTTQDFLTVSSITASSALAAGGAMFGTSSRGGTVWHQVNRLITPLEIAAGISMSSGAVAATAAAWIEHTYDSVTGVYPNALSGANGSTLAFNIGVPTVFQSTSVQNITPSNGLPFWSPFPSDSFAPFSPFSGYRLTITSTSSSATVFVSVVQSGVG